jgi:hypothetical protein
MVECSRGAEDSPLECHCSHAVRYLATDGTLVLVCGNGIGSFSGDNGPASAAQLNTPLGIASDGLGGAWVSDFGNHRIRKISPSLTITTIAGNGSQSYFGDGVPAISARWVRPLLLWRAYSRFVRAFFPCRVVAYHLLSQLLHAVSMVQRA